MPLQSGFRPSSRVLVRRDEAGGDKAGKASRRLPIPGRESPASDRVYPLEGNPTPPDRHEPGAADEACG